MESSGDEFVARLQSWPAKRCLVIARLGASEFRVWLRLKSAALNEIVFRGDLGEEATVDLLAANSYTCGNVESTAESLRCDFTFTDAVSTETADGLKVAVLLPA